MVGARQRRNWGPIQFEVVDDDKKIVASGKSIKDISENYIILKGPEFKKETFDDPADIEDSVEDLSPETPILPPPREKKKETPKSEVVEPEIIEPEIVNEDDFDPDIVEKGSKFKATKRQIQAKLRFHKYCPPGILLQLDPNAPTLVAPGTDMRLIDYIGQMKEPEFAGWVENPIFWAWFITDDDVDADIYQAKQKASALLLDVLEMDDVNPETGMKDMKVVGMKLRVAESILNRNKTIKVENKTLNVKNVFNGSKVPKQLASADVVTLEQRLAKIKENSGG